MTRTLFHDTWDTFISGIDMSICVTNVNIDICCYVESAGKVIVRPRSGV